MVDEEKVGKINSLEEEKVKEEDKKKSWRKVIGMKKLLIFGGLIVGLLIVVRPKSGYEPSSDLEKLKSLPYAAASDLKESEVETGVVLNMKEKSQPGYNLFKDQDNGAFLLDDNGEVVQHWEFPKLYKDQQLHHIEVLEDGEMIGAVEERFIAKIDRESNEIWRTDIPAHHDLEILEDGTILTAGFLIT